MIKCPKCGNEVDSDDEYCKHCSHKLKKKPITDKKNIIIMALIIIITSYNWSYLLFNVHYRTCKSSGCWSGNF